MSASRGAISPYKLASVLLQYPTTALFEGMSELGAAAAQTSPRASRDAFARFLLWLRATPPTQVGQHYVETFDLRRRCALYLTYYRYGDTRKRGMSMLTLKTAYPAHSSVLVQLGLIEAGPSGGLPIAGAETAHKVLDPSLPSNTLMESAR